MLLAMSRCININRCKGAAERARQLNITVVASVQVRAL
jgi:hypothetical protein